MGTRSHQAREHIGRFDAGRQQLRAIRLHGHAGGDQGPHISPIGLQSAHIGCHKTRPLGLGPQQLHRVRQTRQQGGHTPGLHLAQHGLPIGVARQLEGQAHLGLLSGRQQSPQPLRGFGHIGAGQLQHQLRQTGLARLRHQMQVAGQAHRQTGLHDQRGVGRHALHGRAACRHGPLAGIGAVKVELHAASCLRKMSLSGKNWLCSGSKAPPKARACAPTCPASSCGWCMPSKRY